MRLLPGKGNRDILPFVFIHFRKELYSLASCFSHPTHTQLPDEHAFNLTRASISCHISYPHALSPVEGDFLVVV
jgi:hypothetical protein